MEISHNRTDHLHDGVMLLPESISNGLGIMLAKFEDCTSFVKIENHLILWGNPRD
jgi:hypothetical protein